MNRSLLVLALALGALLRLPQLEVRPMHTDEAVHGVKFGALLETGAYAYDRNEYHGPSLNYFTLIPARLLSQRRLADVDETTLRIVPALFGILIILLFPLLVDIGRPSAACGALITAISPALVFFSRYYIQEMLLVSFTFGFLVSGYRLLATGRVAWGIGAGVCAGLMHASKETCLIVFGAVLIALVITVLARGGETNPFVPFRWKHALAVIAPAAFVSVLFFSSFGTHWEGVKDSFLTYQTYFSRAGASAGHEQPWYYYLHLLGWWKVGGGTLWTEGAIILFGAYGIYRAFRGDPAWSARQRDVIRFLAAYALVLWLVYSALPYKTPWSILGAHHGLIIVAGFGVVQFVGSFRHVRWKAVAVALVAVAGIHLLWQSYGNSFVSFDEPSNPYVYSHPGGDVKLIASTVERYAMASAAGKGMPMQVLATANEYWPLPWYLRSFSHVGWWDSVGPEFTPTPVILASPEMEGQLLLRLYESSLQGERLLYVPMFDRQLFLRPGKEIRAYVTLDLRNRTEKERPL
jgi:uncharacterized protein (TIGR03663 family)